MSALFAGLAAINGYYFCEAVREKSPPFAALFGTLCILSVACLLVF